MSHDLSVSELALWRQAGFDHLLIDVRREAARKSDGTELAGTTWHDPRLWLDWKDGVVQAATGRPLVVYCAFGHEISQGLAAALRAMGADARHLEDGIAGWKAKGLPVQTLLGAAPAAGAGA